MWQSVGLYSKHQCCDVVASIGEDILSYLPLLHSLPPLLSISFTYLSNISQWTRFEIVSKYWKRNSQNYFCLTKNRTEGTETYFYKHNSMQLEIERTMMTWLMLTAMITVQLLREKSGNFGPSFPYLWYLGLLSPEGDFSLFYNHS